MFNLCFGDRNNKSIKRKKSKPEKKSKKEIKYVVPNYDIKKKIEEEELYYLKYLGNINVTYNILRQIFGKPHIIDIYKGPFAYEILWYIKFTDGSIISISKYFKLIDFPKSNKKWNICGNCHLGLKHIIMKLI